MKAPVTHAHHQPGRQQDERGHRDADRFGAVQTEGVREHVANLKVRDVGVSHRGLVGGESARVKGGGPAAIPSVRSVFGCRRRSVASCAWRALSCSRTGRRGGCACRANGCRRRARPPSWTRSATCGWCSSTPRASWRARSTSCCSRGWVARFRSPNSNDCCGPSGRCSSTGCTSCRRPTCGSTANRCGATRWVAPRGSWPAAATSTTGSPPTRRSAGTCFANCATKGPLRARDLEDRVADGWHTGGWDDQGRNVARCSICCGTRAR